jgi:hypothetical protein
VGIKVYYHHRTLEEYLDAFLSPGLRLVKLADLTARADQHPPHAIVPDGDRFPRFMLLGFVRPLLAGRGAAAIARAGLRVLLPE